MIWFIGIIGGIILGIYYAYEMSDGCGGYILWPVLFSVLAFVIILIVALFSAIVPVPTANPTLVETTPIAAMADGIGAEGYYRRIETEGKFWVLIETDKGTQMVSYDANKTYIQTTKGSPRVETYRKEPLGCFRTFLFGRAWYTTTEYIIYVPDSADIANDFVVDLE